jgi:3-oxoacyl-[acyl-carrier protein] reductase
VTGASRGIGAAIVDGLVRAGWAVILNHRDSTEDAEAVVRSLGTDASVTVIQADVTDPAAIVAMCDRIRSECGILDALVHNAAPPLRPRRVAQLEWERDLLDPLRIALAGFLNCFQGVRQFLAEDARIVVVLTDALLAKAPAQMGAYLAAKGALAGLMRGLAADLRGSRRIVFGVSPGMTDTDLLAAYGERVLELIAQDLPGGRLADPAVVGRAIARLVVDPREADHGRNVPLAGLEPPEDRGDSRSG